MVPIEMHGTPPTVFHCASVMILRWTETMLGIPGL